MRDGFVVVLLLAVTVGCGYASYQFWEKMHPYNSSVICSDLGDKRIMGEHVRVDYDGRYFMQRSDGKTVVYDKTAFEWCIVIADDDVKK